MMTNGIFGALAGARGAWQQGQRAGQAEADAAEQQRAALLRQREMDELMKRFQTARAMQAERDLAMPPEPQEWKPTTEDEVVRVAERIAKAKAAAEQHNRQQVSASRGAAPSRGASRPAARPKAAVPMTEEAQYLAAQKRIKSGFATLEDALNSPALSPRVKERLTAWDSAERARRNPYGVTPGSLPPGAPSR